MEHVWTSVFKDVEKWWVFLGFTVFCLSRLRYLEPVRKQRFASTPHHLYKRGRFSVLEAATSNSANAGASRVGILWMLLQFGCECMSQCAKGPSWVASPLRTDTFNSSTSSFHFFPLF